MKTQKLSFFSINLISLALLIPDFGDQPYAETLSFLPSVNYPVGVNPASSFCGLPNLEAK